jgi:WS/DGAT/MGAT family acyltransferase
MERVTATAAALLRLESPTAPLNVGWVARLDGHARRDPLDVPALIDRIAGRLPRAPRLRQVAVRVQDGDGELVWREDPHFDLARHVVVWHGPAAGEEEVRRVLDGFLAQPLARERPLWRVLVVPATRSGGAAVAGTVHRALTDGSDAGRLRELIFDVPGSGGGQDSPDALALDELREVHRIRSLARDRGERTRIGETLRQVALTRTVGRLTPPPPSFLDAAGPRPRTFVTARVDAGRLGRIAAHADATVHDVVLALVAGALRRLAVAGGEEPADVRALVPLAVGEDALLGDAPCAVLELPVGEQRADDRLAAVRGSMAAARGGDAGLSRRDGGAVLAGPPEELASRLALGVRVCNMTIPSAIAPAGSLRLAGRRVRALFPVSPVPDEHALALGTLAYERHVHVSAAADAQAVSAIGRLPIILADALEELGLSSGLRHRAIVHARPAD